MKLFFGNLEGTGEDSIREALRFTRLLDVVAGQKVFVKPNFTYPHHTPGVTTTPDFLRNVLHILQETAAELLVGESNGGYGSFLASEAFVGHGLQQICKDTQASIVDLSKSESRIYSKEIGGKATSVLLPRLLVEDVDLTVSIPVLKVHPMTTVSLSVKNLWGCMPTDLRLLEHAQLGRKLALVCELTKARFGIIDATYGLDEHGPMKGIVRRLDKILAADDLYALDWITAKMMGFDPSRVSHLRSMPQTTWETLLRGQVQTNVNLGQMNWHFKSGLEFIDILSLACFHSDAIAKLVFDSPLTQPIYAVLGRKPRRKLGRGDM